MVRAEDEDVLILLKLHEERAERTVVLKVEGLLDLGDEC